MWQLMFTTNLKLILNYQAAEIVWVCVYSLKTDELSEYSEANSHNYGQTYHFDPVKAEVLLPCFVFGAP